MTPSPAPKNGGILGAGDGVTTSKNAFLGAGDGMTSPTNDTMKQIYLLHMVLDEVKLILNL